MKVLISGVNGFLGSALASAFLNNGHDIVGLKRRSSNVQRITDFGNRITLYNVDEIKGNHIYEKEHNIDVVVHAATNYGRNNVCASQIVNDNVLFPINLLENSAKNGVKMFVNTDTFFNKKSNLMGRAVCEGYLSEYMLSKQQFLDWCVQFSSFKNIKIANMRLEHVYGQGDSPSKFIPSIIKDCIENVDYIDLTNGLHQRDFVYIEDVISAYLTIMRSIDKLSYFTELEVGTGKVTKVRDLVCMIKNFTQAQTMLNFGAICNRGNEIGESKAQNQKLINLGWQPKWSVEEGINQIISEIKNKG